MLKPLGAIVWVVALGASAWWFLGQGGGDSAPVLPTEESAAQAEAAAESPLREAVAVEAEVVPEPLEEIVEVAPPAAEPAPVEDLAALDRYQLEALKLRLEDELKSATDEEFQRRFETRQAEFLGPGAGVELGQFMDPSKLMRLKFSADEVWRVVLTPEEFPEANALFQRKRAVEAALAKSRT